MMDAIFIFYYHITYHHLKIIFIIVSKMNFLVFELFICEMVIAILLIDSLFRNFIKLFSNFHYLFIQLINLLLKMNA